MTRILKSILIVAIVVFLALAGLGLALHVRVVSVLTGSMRPHYAPGSLVITRPVKTSALKSGDVIAFRPPSPFTTPRNAPIMHRAISVAHSGSHALIKTRGDANPAPDPWQLDLHDQYTYKAVVAVPYLGTALTAVTDSNTDIRAVSIAGFLLLMIAALAWPPKRPASTRQIVRHSEMCEVVELIADSGLANGIAGCAELSESVPAVVIYGDQTDLRHAFDAMFECVAPAYDEREDLEVSIASTNESVCITLTAPNIAAAVPNTYVTLERVATEHGGSVDLQTTETGTRARLTLPLNSSANQVD